MEYNIRFFKWIINFRLYNNYFQQAMYYWDNNNATWFSTNEMPLYFQPQQFYSLNTQFLPEFNPGYLMPPSPVFQQQEQVYDRPHEYPETKPPVLPKKKKQIEKVEGELIKVSRNIKSLIIKQYVKHLKKDASKMLELKERLGVQYPIKKFIEKMCRKIPAGKEKYIKVKTIQQLCFNDESQQFSQIMRILLRNFLKTDFEICVLNKKKNKAQYLKGSRQLYSRIFGRKQQQKKAVQSNDSSY